MFYRQALRLGDKPFLWAKEDGKYKPLSWRQTAERVSRLSNGLTALGVEPGDRVVLVSENRPEWLIADVAIMAAGAITVPAYTTNTGEDHLHVVADSGAKGAIVSSQSLMARFLPAARKSALMEFTVAMDDHAVSQQSDMRVIPWQRVLAGEGPGDNLGRAADKAGQWKPTDTACIIYTSGTGGAPKGVMLSHQAILHNCAGARDALEELGLGDEVFLSFLPLSHSYEHSAGQFFPMSIGAQIYYAEGLEALGRNMIEARPTIMTAVPRLYEMLQDRITRGVRQAGGMKEKLFFKTVDLGCRRYDDAKGLGLLDRVTDSLLTVLVRKKVARRFGGRLKAMVSGGAPLNPDVGKFFIALGLGILQGYGQTEAAPVISVNRPRKVKIDSVGPPILDTEVRIASDGEICVRGALVMQGYWRNEKATHEVIRDGWLHTGDVGMIDGDGYIRITDRKKDIIVNSGGDNLSPQRVEGILTLEPEIAQAMVHGDKRPHLVAVIVPGKDWAEEWARKSGRPADPVDLAGLAGDDEFRKAIGRAVDTVNARLSNTERVRKFILAVEPFTIDNGQLTPTMKIRRHVIHEVYGESLEALYR